MGHQPGHDAGVIATAASEVAKPDVSFNNLAIVLAVAFFSRLLLGLAPRLRVPGVVVEIILGIVIGPSVLGWAEADEPVQLLALVGLAFLLFLSGLEIELDQLRGRLLRVAALGLAASVVLGLVAGFVLDATGLISNPLLVGVTLIATSLGLVIPVLKEGGLNTTPFGQLVIVGATLGDFTAVLLLSLLFSRDASGTGSKLILLAVFILLLVIIAISVAGLGRRMRISQVLVGLQDATAQIRVRGAMLLLVTLVVVAEKTGLETILGAFVAGAVVSVIDRDVEHTHHPVPGQARRHRLRVPHPDLLHRQRPPCARLPQPGRERSCDGGGRLVAGHVAAVHRHRLDDRRRHRRPHTGHWLGLRGRRPPVSDLVPGHLALAAAPDDDELGAGGNGRRGAARCDVTRVVDGRSGRGRWWTATPQRRFEQR